MRAQSARRNRVRGGTIAPWRSSPASGRGCRAARSRVSRAGHPVQWQRHGARQRRHLRPPDAYGARPRCTRLLASGCRHVRRPGTATSSVSLGLGKHLRSASSGLTTAPSPVAPRVALSWCPDQGTYAIPYLPLRLARRNSVANRRLNVVSEGTFRPPVERLDRSQETEVSILDQPHQGPTRRLVRLGDFDDEPKV